MLVIPIVAAIVMIVGVPLAFSAVSVILPEQVFCVAVNEGVVNASIRIVSFCVPLVSPGVLASAAAVIVVANAGEVVAGLGVVSVYEKVWLLLPEAMLTLVVLLFTGIRV